jgi:putative transcriptional regulator
MADQEDTIDVAGIRLSAGRGATQAAFATALGISVRTLRNWEQGTRRPTGPAVVLLTLVMRNPGILRGLSPNRLFK